MGSMLLRAVPPTTVVRILRGPGRGLRWVAGSSNHACWLGAFEPEVTRALADALTPNTVFFDVGANVGYHTVCASRQASCVVAFEPLDANLAKLRRHVSLNRLANVAIVPAAVAESRGELAFDPGAEGSMAHFNESGPILVPTVSIDDEVISGRLPVPDVVKIDVEGAEGRVLAGALTVLRKHRPVLVIATHGKVNHDPVVALLAALDYEVRVMKWDVPGEYGELVAWSV